MEVDELRMGPEASKKEVEKKTSTQRLWNSCS